MKIFIWRNAKQEPVSVEQISAELAAGTLKPSDLAWIEGWKAWQPVSAVPGVQVPAQPPPLPKQQSPASSIAKWKMFSPELRFGTIALICGLCSWTCILFFLCIPAVVFGHLALHRAKNSQANAGKTRAILGLTLGYAMIALTAFSIAFHGPIDRANTASVTIAKDQVEAKQPDESKSDTFSLGWLSPKVTVRDGNGEFSYTVPYTYSPKLAGWNIAQYVFKAANKRKDLTQITVVCDLGIADLVDKYGHKVERPYIMGDIVVKDLDEVRRYNDEDAYAHQAQYWYGEELSRLDYSEFMAKH
jgi:hypothetical protein